LPSFFERSFAIKPDQVTIDHVAKAIAAYERTLIAGNSRFGRFFFGRDKSALSASERRGLNIFRRKGNCANCHEISWDHALFTDNRFYNIGIGFSPLTQVPKLVESIQSGSVEIPELSPVQKSALGRFNVTRLAGDTGKFKTPTLRNIALTAPYMHDGSLKSLKEVIEYYDRGGDKNPFLDPAIFPLRLSPQEKMDLGAFLNALTSRAFESPDPN
jgi:cytochrome c peroxidase